MTSPTEPEPTEGKKSKLREGDPLRQEASEPAREMAAERQLSSPPEATLANQASDSALDASLEPTSIWQLLRGKFLTRRAGLIALGIGGVGFLLGTRVQKQTSRVTDPVVDTAAQAIRDALGFDVITSDLTISVTGYGTLPLSEWEAARGNPSFYDKWYDSPPPATFVPFEGKISGNLVSDRGVYLKAIRYHEVSPRELVGERRALLNVGGGDGDPLHAYIVIGDPPAIRYTQNGSPPSRDVFFRVSEDSENPTFITVSVLVIPPVIVELKVQLIFQRSGRQEFSKLEFGPLRVSGPAAEGSPELLLGYGTGEVKVGTFTNDVEEKLK